MKNFFAMMQKKGKFDWKKFIKNLFALNGYVFRCGIMGGLLTRDSTGENEKNRECSDLGRDMKIFVFFVVL